MRRDNNTRNTIALQSDGNQNSAMNRILPDRKYLNNCSGYF